MLITDTPNPGANPATSEFTTSTPARAFFRAEENIVIFKTH
jgi:hypothetical protein